MDATGFISRLLRGRHFRGKNRLLQALSPKHGERQATVFGYEVPLDLQDHIQRGIYLGTFEPEETQLLAASLKPGMTFVDVGANIGYYTFLACRLAGPSGRIFAFEPSPYAFARLERALKHNHLAQAEAINAALGPEAGILPLFLPNTAGNHTPSLISTPGNTPHDVPVLRLDAFLAERKVEQVDLIKMDVEGFELQVLKGLELYLAQGRVAGLLVELNRWWLEKLGHSMEGVHALLRGYGYRVEARLSAGDGFENVFFRR